MDAKNKFIKIRNYFSFLLFVHISHRIIRINRRSPFWFLPILRQSSLQCPQIFSLLYRIFIIFEKLDIGSLSINIGSGSKNCLFINLLNLLLEFFDFLVKWVFYVGIIRTKSSWKITPLSSPCFLRIHLIINT